MFQGEVVLCAGEVNPHKSKDIDDFIATAMDILTPWLKGKPADLPLFNMPNHTAEMVRTDLRRARACWIRETQDRNLRKQRRGTDTLMDVDGEGREVDFHALRHTYITRLAQSGASVKVAQELARHSTPVLTLGRYSHIGLHDTSKALDALPSLAPPDPKNQVMAKTGTDDIPPAPPMSTSPKTYPDHLATPLATIGGDGRVCTVSGGEENFQKSATCKNDETPKNIVFSGVFKRRRRDSNPRTTCAVSGFQDRCIKPLCHTSELFPAKA